MATEKKERKRERKFSRAKIEERTREEKIDSRESF